MKERELLETWQQHRGGWYDTGGSEKAGLGAWACRGHRVAVNARAAARLAFNFRNQNHGYYPVKLPMVITLRMVLGTILWGRVKNI